MSEIAMERARRAQAHATKQLARSQADLAAAIREQTALQARQTAAAERMHSLSGGSNFRGTFIGAPNGQLACGACHMVFDADPPLTLGMVEHALQNHRSECLGTPPR